MVVSLSSTAIKRVCRATLQTETYALQKEAGDRIRVVLAETYGFAEIYGFGSLGTEWDTLARYRTNRSQIVTV